jgi:hypothetical protein
LVEARSSLLPETVRLLRRRFGAANICLLRADELPKNGAPIVITLKRLKNRNV